jgi:hypothetical protein
MTALFWAFGRCPAAARTADRSGAAAPAQLARCRPGRRRHVGQLSAELLQRLEPIVDGGALLVGERDVLLQPEEVRLGLEQLGLAGALRPVERALGAL